jgi:hypothetical protein
MSTSIIAKDFDYTKAVKSISIIKNIFKKRTVEFKRLEEFSNKFKENKIIDTISFFNQTEDSIEFGFDNIVGRLKLKGGKLMLLDEFEIWSKDMGYEHPDLTLEDIEYFANEQKEREEKFVVDFLITKKEINISGENLKEVQEKFHNMPLSDLIEKITINKVTKKGDE